LLDEDIEQNNVDEVVNNEKQHNEDSEAPDK
jgi:hypothetical protein